MQSAFQVYFQNDQHAQILLLKIYGKFSLRKVMKPFKKMAKTKKRTIINRRTDRNDESQSEEETNGRSTRSRSRSMSRSRETIARNEIQNQEQDMLEERVVTPVSPVNSPRRKQRKVSNRDRGMKKKVVRKINFQTDNDETRSRRCNLDLNESADSDNEVTFANSENNNATNFAQMESMSILTRLKMTFMKNMTVAIMI